MTDLTLFIGLDVHKKTISVALVDAAASATVRFYGTIVNTPDALLGLSKKLSKDGQPLHFCYEAGPCGYGSLRDELLNETLFSSLDHARNLLADWQDDYNTIRPHSSIGNLPPATYAKLTASDMQRDRTLRYVEGSAPRPVASPSHTGSNDQRALPIAG